MASKVQYQVYQYLANHQGLPPTVREISTAVGRSVSTTHKILKQLKTKGFVTWEPTKRRTVRLVHYV